MGCVWLEMNTRILAIGWVCISGALAGTIDSLPAEPQGIGCPAADRGWWQPLAETKAGKRVIAEAAAELPRQMPAFDPERYLDFTRNGDRSRYQATHRARWGRFSLLVMAECLEDDGRFIPGIAQAVESLCGDPSWLLPAHDRRAQVFHGAAPYADLAVAMNGCQMAMAEWLLGERLPPETRELMRENVRRRLLDPVLQTIGGTAPPHVKSGHWWIGCDHNWNSVCTAGFIGALLTQEPSRETRAMAVDWAVKNMEVFLSGFGEDGYCSEGIGYWNYGFSHYAFLAEIIRAHTSGRVNLYDGERVRLAARTPARLEIADLVYPAFADCAWDSRPDASLVELLRMRLDGVPFDQGRESFNAPGRLIYMNLCYLAARDESPAETGRADSPAELDTWLQHSGICVVRPAAKGGLAVAWKGGHNNEHHNHNDVGSTVVVWKGRPVIVDPGMMTYRAETFNRQLRYRQPLMGSFGHSVPMPAGMLQKEGADARGVVLRHEFTDTRAAMVIDLSSAYPDAGLTKLERHWSYQRDGLGTLVIEDHFAFERPSSFGTALVSFGEWYMAGSKQGKSLFAVDSGEGAVLEVEVDFPNTGVCGVNELINSGRPTARRLGLDLSEPVREGVIRMTIRPLAGGLPENVVKLPVLKTPAMLDDARRAPAAE